MQFCIRTFSGIDFCYLITKDEPWKGKMNNFFFGFCIFSCIVAILKFYPFHQVFRCDFISDFQCYSFCFIFFILSSSLSLNFPSINIPLISFNIETCLWFRDTKWNKSWKVLEFLVLLYFQLHSLPFYFIFTVCGLYSWLTFLWLNWKIYIVFLTLSNSIGFSRKLRC